MSDSGERGLALERVVFFSDAVFAIAITLLVIDLRLPEAVGGERVVDLLSQMVPELLAFGLSFAVIGVIWTGHWRRFGYIARVDDRLLVLNLVQLAFIALMPFPTAVISEHGDDPGAVILYVAVITAAGLASAACWWHARRAGLLVPELPDRYERLLVLRGLVVPVVMMVSLLLLPLVGAYLTELSWLLIVPISALVSRRIRHLAAAIDVPPPA